VIYLEICELKKEDEEAWGDYVYKSDSSTFYHQVGWKNVVEKTYKHKPIYLIARENGDIKGILPLFLMKSMFFGKKLVSISFAPYGGACADNETVEKALIEEAKSITQECGADYLEFRYLNENKNEPGLAINNNYVTFVLNLSQDSDIVWKKFNNKVRNAIRKALKSNLEISRDNDLKEFYSLYTKNIRDLGTPPHSYAFFKNLLLEFPEYAKIVRVQHGSMTIAALFLVSFKDTLISGWAATDKAYQKFNQNNLLYWEVIKHGCEGDYKYFDFGRSIYNSGTFKFKKPWGAEPEQLCYQYYLCNMKNMPDTSQSNPKRQRFAKVWNKVPLPIANFVGSKIRRNFP
jgi:FemAB-related protein (PEP-CTERM system-associated)